MKGFSDLNRANVSPALTFIRWIFAEIERWMATSKFASASLRRHLVPWPWDIGKPLVSNTLFRILQTWVVLLPLAVGLISAFPVVIGFEGFYFSIGENFSAPFSFKASFVSAVLLLMAILLFRWRCPSVVSKNSADFSSIPRSVTDEMLVEQIRDFILAGLPRRLSIGDEVIVESLRSPIQIERKSGYSWNRISSFS